MASAEHGPSKPYLDYLTGASGASTVLHQTLCLRLKATLSLLLTPSPFRPKHTVPLRSCNKRYVATACIMVSSLLRRAWKSIHRLTWKPLAFPKEGIASISASEKIEEETIPGYVATRYYPVRIGQIFQNRYQVVGKLGFGITSTVWLARDLQ
jgi:hypothetical protein